MRIGKKRMKLENAFGQHSESLDFWTSFTEMLENTMSWKFDLFLSSAKGKETSTLLALLETANLSRS
jgi:hypothetical protein